MTLQELFNKHGQPAMDRIAQRAGTTPAYLSMIRRGHNRASADMARRIHDADPRVSLTSLRPDFWRRGK